MATFFTWAQIKAKLQADIDLEDEQFITVSELLSYVNEAIDEAEAEIHTLYEDYFLKEGSIALVSGTSNYSMPSDIYAHKIRKMVYVNGAQIFEIPRLKDWNKFVDKELINFTNVGNEYQYYIKNETAGQPKIYFSPVPTESGAYVKIWYLRNANRLSVDADVCDIPEFINFIYQYVKVRCLEKEMHPNLQMAIQVLEHYRTLMQGTLSNMVPDDRNEVEMDLSHYEEMI